MLMFPLAEGVTCPKCGVKLSYGSGALSRRNNKTNIWSDCVTAEAMEDLRSVLR